VSVEALSRGGEDGLGLFRGWWCVCNGTCIDPLRDWPAARTTAGWTMGPDENRGFEGDGATGLGLETCAM